jgi:hypothetical protein
MSIHDSAPDKDDSSGQGGGKDTRYPPEVWEAIRKEWERNTEWGNSELTGPTLLRPRLATDAALVQIAEIVEEVDFDRITY